MPLLIRCALTPAVATRCPSRNRGRFRLSGVGSLAVLVTWSWLWLRLIGSTPWWVEPRYGKREVQKRKKPRLWRSWLSLETVVAGAFWRRGTVHDAPCIYFTGYKYSYLVEITLAIFAPWLELYGLPGRQRKCQCLPHVSHERYLLSCHDRVF